MEFQPEIPVKIEIILFNLHRFLQFGVPNELSLDFTTVPVFNRLRNKIK